MEEIQENKEIRQNQIKIPILEILELTDDKIKFVLDNCQVHVANALRRIMLAEVPTIAPHLVDIQENTSPLPDEFIAHRIGLIPLVSSKLVTQSEKNFQYTWECECTPNTECNICTEYFSINVTNHGDLPLVVTSEDIIKKQDTIQDSDSVQVVQMKSVFDPSKKVGIPILQLAKNQKFQCTIKAFKGYGKMHAKWSPVSVGAFAYEPIITLQPELQLLVQEKKEQFIQTCPTNVFSLNQTHQIEVTNPEKCMYCNECTKYLATECIDPPEGVQYFESQQPSVPEVERLVQIKQKQDKFIFNVETTGSLKPAEVVKKAFAVLRQKLQKFQDHMTSHNTVVLDKNPSNLQ